MSSFLRTSLSCSVKLSLRFQRPVGFYRLQGSYRIFHSQTSIAQEKSTVELKSRIIKSKISDEFENEKRLDLDGSVTTGNSGVSHDLEVKRPIVNLDSIFIISIPITTHRSFIYCNHKPGLLSDKQRSEVRWIVKVENKLVGLAVKGWNKLEGSEVSINRKIVHLIRRLLSSIPYDENSLRSFPRKSAMIREINEESREEFPRAVMTSQIENAAVSVDQIKPIPVYHPKFQEPQAILNQMNKFKNSLTSYHKKWAMVCAVAIPVSLPMALLPVVPNVPGFYFAYRLYCHLQALRGANNLGYLLESTDDSIEDTTHLAFRSLSGLDKPYLEKDIPEQSGDEKSESKEKVLINSKIVDQIVGATGLDIIKDDLLRALAQESRRLEGEVDETQENQ